MAFTPPDSPGGAIAAGRRPPASSVPASRATSATSTGRPGRTRRPAPSRSKFTLIVGVVFIAFVVLGALPLVLRSGDGQLVQPNCTTPAVATGPAKIKPGTDFAWQAAGPRAGAVRAAPWTRHR
jgi:hypothetical protein